jgi:phosphate transport system permease protein
MSPIEPPEPAMAQADPAEADATILGPQPSASIMQTPVEPAVETSLAATAGVPLSTRGGGRRRMGDRVFATAAGGAAAVVILIVILVAAFLLIKAVPSIADDKANFLTSTKFNVGKSGSLEFGIAGLLYTTVMSSLIALLLAVPLAIGIALFTTQYAPERIARPVAHAIDLLAAIPSIIYGVWGIRILAPKLKGIEGAFSHIGLGIFGKPDQTILGSTFDAGVVLAIMILPIITAISRDVFDRTPNANKEAALALGATRWEMIRMAVLPHGRPGVISGAMLGLGRALGETIAVLLILSKVGFSFSILNGGETFASKIVNGSGEFGSHPGPYIAAGLVLFVLTFVVNAIARAIVARRKEFV